MRAPGRLRAAAGLLSLTVALALAVLVLLSSPASAHAVLESTVPADGDELATAPTHVTLAFNEEVSAPTGGIRVFDADARRVDLGELLPSAPDELHLGLQPDLGPGTYVVTWRAVSADGHPIKGAFLFFVGGAGVVDEGLVQQLFDSGSDRPVAVAGTLFRAAMYFTLLAAAGLIAFVLVVPGLSEDERRRILGWARRAAVVAAAATVLGVSLQTALVTGLGPRSMLDPSLIAETLGSDFGTSSLLRAAALVGLALTLPRRLRVAAAAAAVSLASLLLSGHSVTAQPRVLVLAADATHLVATSVWLGGLVALVAVLRHRTWDDDPAAASEIVARFSRLAMWTVLAVVASGSAWAWAEVRAVRALTSTAYGWTLMTKLALVGVVLTIGAFNRRRLVPAIARAAAGEVVVPAGGAVDHPPAPSGPDQAWRLLRRAVRLEVAALAAVALVTAGLVYLQPAAEAAGITGVFSAYADLGDDAEVNLVVDPNRAGVNQVHVYLLDRTGRPASLADGITFSLSLPASDIGPIVREPLAAGPGHWILTGPELSIPGRWEITVEARVSEFDQVTTTIPVTVNP